MSAEFKQLSGNTYIINQESAAEMARLLDQDKSMTQAMGGIFPELTNIEDIFDVLDIACGPGGWVHEVAHTYPEMEVVGIDISQRMISYARAHSQVRKLQNAQFRVMDALKPLDFPDASFDMVNARTIFAFMSPTTWPKLLAECRRILRPRGIIRLVEIEQGPTNQLAFETFISLINKALAITGHSFSPTGQFIAIHPMLARLIREAGFEMPQNRASILDYSFGMPAYESMRQDFAIMLNLLIPFLVKTQVATQEYAERLYEQSMQEMDSEDFCGMTYILTAWGRKAAE